MNLPAKVELQSAHAMIAKGLILGKEHTTCIMGYLHWWEGGIHRKFGIIVNIKMGMIVYWSLHKW